MDQQNMKSKISSSLECALPLQTEENNNNENARDNRTAQDQNASPKARLPSFNFVIQ